MAFIRFISVDMDSDSGVEAGLFQLAHKLSSSGELTDVHRTAIKDSLSWFSTNLTVPERFNRTSSKGFYRRAPKGIAWFRDTATEHIGRMYELKHIAESYGHVVSVIVETRVGYLVYQDEVQVVAEPFSETRTHA
jgi:hypothetical protein